MGAVFKRRGGASLGMGRGFNSAGNELQFCFEKGMIFGMIGPRSGHDRATIFILVDRRSSSGRLEAIPQGKDCDRSSIAPRSWLDRGSIGPRSDRDRRFFHVLSAPSDDEHLAMKITTVRWRSDISDASTQCF